MQLKIRGAAAARIQAFIDADPVEAGTSLSSFVTRTVLERIAGRAPPTVRAWDETTVVLPAKLVQQIRDLFRKHPVLTRDNPDHYHYASIEDWALKNLRGSIEADLDLADDLENREADEADPEARDISRAYQKVVTKAMSTPGMRDEIEPLGTQLGVVRWLRENRSDPAVRELWTKVYEARKAGKWDEAFGLAFPRSSSHSS